MNYIFLHKLNLQNKKRKQVIKDLFLKNPDGVIAINNKWQIHLKYDQDLKKLVKEGFLKQIRQRGFVSTHNKGWKKSGKNQSLLVLN